MDRASKTVLCIDDHQASLSGWALFLQTAGYGVHSSSSAEEGLQIFATRAIDAVLLDYSMPEMSGAEVAAAMKRIKPEVPVVMFTGFSGLPESVLSSVDAVVVKGSPPAELLDTMDRLLTTDPTAASAAELS